MRPTGHCQLVSCDELAM